jgi:hypothetical protein
MISALFCDVTQRGVVVIYRRFRTTFLSYLQRWRSPRPKMGPIVCPETSVQNYHSTLRNIPEELKMSFFTPISDINRALNLQSSSCVSLHGHQCFHYNNFVEFFCHFQDKFWCSPYQVGLQLYTVVLPIMTPSSFVRAYQHLARSCCLHFQSQSRFYPHGLGKRFLVKFGKHVH